MCFTNSAAPFIGVGLFSALINLLMLSGSMFMLQVYDRVLPSKSVPTLIGLSLIFLGLYAFQAILDLIRTRVLVRIGSAFDESISERVYGAVIKLPLRGARAADALQPVRDLDTIRNFLTGLGPTALFDLPWMPLYLALCFAFNFYIGLAATVGAIVIVTLTVIIEITSRGPIRDVAKFSAARSVFAESSRAHSEVLHALGMTGRMGARWCEANAQFSDAQQRVSDVTGGLGSIAKVLRLILQSAVLGVGAYLVIQNEATAGIIIASSIITARALAPVDIAIANWKGFGAARQSWHRLNGVACGPSGRARRPSAAEAIGQFVGREHGRGSARLEEDGGAGHQLQSRGWVSTRNCRSERFRQVLAGEGSAGRVAGFLRRPCASTAPSLANGPAILLDVIWVIFPRTCRFATGPWPRISLGSKPIPRPTPLLPRRKAAGVHDLILGLPNGYETAIGERGETLSAGYRQRIGLARALYGDPFLVILDEPNSNLDMDGEMALAKAILGVCERGGIVIVIAHRPSVLSTVDLVLALVNGQTRAFGKRDEVLTPMQVVSNKAPAPREPLPTHSLHRKPLRSGT